jgi:signal transduction histidine kinase
VGKIAATSKGSGLGLYLVDWIARFHGGHMEVSAVAGRGSTFHLCLPIAAPNPTEYREEVQ